MDQVKSQRLTVLAEACSGALYGGDSGWKHVRFEEFVTDCRKAIAFSARCKNAGFIPPTKLRVKRHKLKIEPQSLWVRLENLWIRLLFKVAALALDVNVALMRSLEEFIEERI